MMSVFTYRKQIKLKKEFDIINRKEMLYVFYDLITRNNINDFSTLMNKTAKELGCKNSNFITPNGIHDDRHYSTAYDLAMIAKYCMQNQSKN